MRPGEFAGVAGVASGAGDARGAGEFVINKSDRDTPTGTVDSAGNRVPVTDVNFFSGKEITLKPKTKKISTMKE